MELKHFQTKSVEKLMVAIKRNLKSVEDNPELPLQHIIFKSPTGSGKTVMLSETLKFLAEDDVLNERNLIFLWLAPMKLHSQSYKKLKEYLQDSDYQLINIDDGLPNGALGRNTILFSNWEKLTTTAGQDNPEKNIKKGDWTNIATRQGESGKNLIDILGATRENNTKIILIIDESHQSFYGDKSQRFVKEIVKPSLVIEASATPKFEQTQAQVIETPYEEVVDSGLIKKQIVINNELGKISSETNNKTVMESLIDLALSKQKELKDAYVSINEDINPLLLIQLPNCSSEMMDELDKTEKDLIEKILTTKGITYNNKKLAVWLSEEKINLEDIEQLNNQVEILIFKQAIALGWDCPRAQLLIMRRDVKSETFKIQTVGRILRMPKAEHYDSELLNTAYVYSDLESIVVDRVEQDPLINLVKYQQSKIRDEFRDKIIVLPDSIYLSRTDYGDLRKDFEVFLRGTFNDRLNLSLFKTVAERRKKISESLQIDDTKLLHPVITDEVIQNIDELSDRIGLSTVNVDVDIETLDYIFNALLREFIKPFTGFARSRAIVYPVLRDLFSQADINEKTMKKIFVCSSDNQEKLKTIFALAINNYKSTYQCEQRNRRERSEIIYDWTVPTVDVFSDNYAEVPTVKNIYDHFYRYKKVSESEKRFEMLLDASTNILWWHKNGEKMQHHFAIGYHEQIEDENKIRRNSFYPDYIVSFKDGTIGIFEIKSGADTSPDYHSNVNNPNKADSLQKWIQGHIKLGVWGGIVNRAENNSFMIQADAVTQEMAYMASNGESVELPNIKYDSDKWRELVL